MVFTVPATNSLTVSLVRTAVDIDRYPIARIDTNPDKLLRQWSSRHPEWLMDKGEKKFRIDDRIPGGGATIETFNTTVRIRWLLAALAPACGLSPGRQPCLPAIT
ncbi:hypothetical protein ACWFPY_20550 [Nocardia fluminea]